MERISRKFALRCVRVFGQTASLFITMCAPGPYPQSIVVSVTSVVARTFYLPLATLGAVSISYEFACREHIYTRLLEERILVTFPKIESFTDFIRGSPTAQSCVCMVLGLCTLNFTDRSAAASVSTMVSSGIMLTFFLLDMHEFRQIPRKLVTLSHFVHSTGGGDLGSAGTALSDCTVVSEDRVRAYCKQVAGRKMDFVRFADDIKRMGECEAPDISEPWASPSQFFDAVDVRFSKSLRRTALACAGLMLLGDVAVFMLTQFLIPLARSDQMTFTKATVDG